MEQLEPKNLCVDWSEGSCVLLDQTQLPSKVIFQKHPDYRGVVRAIQTLAVRGAPAIGVAAAYAIVLAYREALGIPERDRSSFWSQAISEVSNARPTAVNLAWAVRKMLQVIEGREGWHSDCLGALEQEAQAIHRADICNNRRMAELGASLLGSHEILLTHCNTGDLATGGIGTAFGVIHEGYRMGKVKQVFACEARPILQGLRLTAWELQQAGIPFSVICDSMAASIIREKKVSAILTGADRIAANGDSANKIGTFALAILASYFKIPFYIVAPLSTFDASLRSGSDIPIEQRAPEEILSALGANLPGSPFPVENPAFDVTPATLISAIICEAGIITEPTEEKVAAVLRRAQNEKPL